jgi:hypothetical protein
MPSFKPNEYFMPEFWTLSPQSHQFKAVYALKKLAPRRDLDGQLIYSLMNAIRYSEFCSVREIAVDCFEKIVASRNSGVSFPPEWLNSLAIDSRAELSAFKSSKLVRHQSSSISKYPSYPFEVDNIEAFYDGYMMRPVDYQIHPYSRICTLGSCFAINIARYLRDSGYNAQSFELGELVNNTYTNLFILENNIDFASEWATLQPQMAQSVAEFKRNLAEADCIIFTLGLGLAFYSDTDGSPLTNPLYSYRKEHYKGYSMKPIPVDRNLSNFRDIIKSIERINKDAKVIVTLSPVPLDGCKGDFVSAIEADCISKSIGRLTLAMAEAEGLDFSYFPSYELVRWVATARHWPPAFGGDADDIYLRHPTSSVIKSVMNCFVRQYCLSSSL